MRELPELAAMASLLRHALNLVRDIPPAAVPDADTAALLNRGCQTLQASLISLQSALAGPGDYIYPLGLPVRLDRAAAGRPREGQR